MPKSQRATPSRTVSSPPLNESEIDELQALLDQVPAPFEPLDTSMLDGFLCGVLVQPQRVPDARWLAHVTDADGKPLPPDFDAGKLHMLAQRRYAELDAAISGRQWFDPWIFELEGSDEPSQHPALETEAVYPWVAGLALALDLFPALMHQADSAALLEPLALIYRHLDPDDLEDAEELLGEIETLEPPADLNEAVEELVRAILLLADLGRPLPKQASRGRSSRPPRRV